MDEIESKRVRLDRQRILDVAWRHFARHGFRNTSLSGIASELGVVKGALYYYVPGGKRELFEAVLARDERRVLDAMALAVHSAPDARAGLRAMIVAKLGTLREVKDLLGLGREVAEEIVKFVRERPDGFIGRERELIEQLLEDGETAGIFRPVRPRRTAAGAIQAMLHTVTLPSVYGDPLDEDGLPTTLEPVLDLLLRGLEQRS
ncbi:MAG: TetR/AcrR family transcriptional regulator [Acidobacteria bacterium]|nr:TetR/AcrR family transcriptional regulator [Acidobacteriota bacterium]